MNRGFLLKNNITFSLILLLGANYASAQMRQLYVDNQVVDNHIYKLSFFSPSAGYVAFKNWIGYTTDSGRTFAKKYITNNNVDYGTYAVNLTFGFAISGVKAFSNDTLLVYGDYGLVPAILRSTNGGNSYTLVFHSQFNGLQLSGGITDMIFPQNSNTGYATDADRIIKTINRGISWSVSYTGSQSFFSKLEGVSDAVVSALCTNVPNKLLKTTNAGAGWSQVNYPSLAGGKMRFANFLDANLGWMSLVDDNNNYYLFKTTDGGSNWTQLNNIIATPFTNGNFKFIDNNTGYVLYNNYVVYKTINGGITWEPIPRDNNYTYQGWSHFDLQFISPSQFWAGGGQGFLEINTNAGGSTLPRAYFRIDTTGVDATGMVNLFNYSRTGYSYKWLLNGVQLSTAYDTNYVHNVNRTIDTIALIVNNGFKTDTLIRYQSFAAPIIITGFTPAAAVAGTTITITGTNFENITAVRFGGLAAASFHQVSSTEVSAVVSSAGASGSVTLISPLTSGSRPGFTFYPPLVVNLVPVLADRILCKSEPVVITIQNSQPDVIYQLVDSLDNNFGYGSGPGGTLIFTSLPVSVSGTYRIKISRVISSQYQYLTKKIFILVEHTKAAFAADRINIIPGETVRYKSQSLDAQAFSWDFYGDASVAGSNTATSPALSYITSGQKSLRLISTSAYGCRDTLLADAVFVYDKPSPGLSCFAHAVHDIDLDFPAPGPTAGETAVCSDGGFLVSGLGNKPLLSSNIGNSRQFNNNAQAYLAKFTADGVLSWNLSMNTLGNFYGAACDDEHNIYVIGSCSIMGYLTLTNGDSIRIAATRFDSMGYAGKENGFLLKLDSNGNYLWHTIFDDTVRVYLGVPVKGGYPQHITIKGDQVLITGRCLNNLAYYRNGERQLLVNLPTYVYENDMQNNFVCKLRRDGTLVWNMYFENRTLNYEPNINRAGIDNKGNCYITGMYKTWATIHDAGNVNNFTISATRSTGAFLLKFDSSGRYKWKVNMNNDFAYNIFEIKDHETDGEGNSYLTGGTVFVDSTAYFTITNSDGSESRVSIASYFLLKFDSSGHYRWADGTRYLSPYSGYYANGSTGYSILLKGNVLYAAGSVSNASHSVTFTSADNINLDAPASLNSFFINRYDTAGVLKKVMTSDINITDGIIMPNRLISDSKGNFVVSGKLEGIYNSGLHIFNTTVNGDNQETFYAKIDTGACIPSIPVANAGADTLICVHDSIRIGASPVVGNTYSWTSNPTGFSSASANPFVKPLLTTKYFLSVTNIYGLIATDTVVITVLSSASAYAGPDIATCEGVEVLLPGVAPPGTSVSWISNPAGFSSTQLQPLTLPADTTQYYFTVSRGACTVRDTLIVFTFSASIPPAVKITQDSAACAGEPIIFRAIPVNAGLHPLYTWFINDIESITSYDSVQTLSGINPNDLVKLAMGSDQECSSKPAANSNVLSVFFPDYVFNGTGNWNDPDNWCNHLLPPATLPSGKKIYINPAGNSACILNVQQIISAGAALVVAAGKTIIIQGNLIVQ